LLPGRCTAPERWSHRRRVSRTKQVRYPPIGDSPLSTVVSTDRCNTLGEGLRWRSIEQGLSGPFVELPGDGAELGPGCAGTGRSRGADTGGEGGWCFRSSLAARVIVGLRSRPRRRMREPAACDRQFLAPVPGQGPIEFGGQFPRLFNQGGDDAFGVLVGDLDSMT